MNLSEAKITVTIRNSEHVELSDFTDSFKALADQYKKFVAESDKFHLSKESRLYIKEVRHGSIIMELVDLLPTAIEFANNSNAIFEFTSFLKSSYDYFKGKSTDKPKEYDVRDCNNLSNILKTVAKDPKASIAIEADKFTNNGVVNIFMSSTEANAAQNGISREKEAIREPTSDIRREVLFYWDSAKYNEQSKSMDRGRVDSVSKSALKVLFPKDMEHLRKQMMEQTENPFHKAYYVDVEVLTTADNPTAYKILKLHEILDKDNK